MALKDTWEDLQDVVQGVPDSGDVVSVEPINKIAHAVIDLEEDKENGESEIPEISVEDLDNLTTTGIYKALSDGKFEIYIVSGHYNLVMQTLFSGEEITSRKLTADGWSEWDRVAMNSTFELAVQEVVSLLANKEDISNKITVDEWNAVDYYDRPSQLYTDDRYLSAKVAYALHEDINMTSEHFSNKILGSDEFDTYNAQYYSAKATDERIETAIQSAIHDSWEAAV